MPWECKTVEETREEFVSLARDCDNLSKLCREFNISRPTGYKWLHRAECKELLCNRSKAPLHKPKKTDSQTEEMILTLRYANPGWGGKKIRKVLMNQGLEELPCIKTCCNILKRNGCVSPEESLKHQPYKRFEKDYCNQMWQTDFKGDFLMRDGSRCYPLDIIDDYSRFAIKIAPFTTTANAVLPSFEAAFAEYGMPDSVLSDNGAQFAGFRQGFTLFEKWLMNNDVLPIHGRIKHPQTQGKIERFHRAMKSELLSHRTFENIQDASNALGDWREKYNQVRPHEALDMMCPAEIYTKSTRTYTGTVTPYEYSGQYHVIKVNSWGCVRFDKWQIYLSETMIGETIEFRPNPHGDSFIACYRNFCIAEFDVHTGRLIHRNISRI